MHFLCSHLLQVNKQRFQALAILLIELQPTYYQWQLFSMKLKLKLTQSIKISYFYAFRGRGTQHKI